MNTGSTSEVATDMARGKVRSRQQVLDYISSNKERLLAEYHLRRIALIGSFAREEQGPGSDVDVLLELEPGTPDIFGTKRRLQTELESAFGRHVELASERYLKPYFREDILRDAIYV